MKHKTEFTAGLLALFLIVGAVSASALHEEKETSGLFPAPVILIDAGHGGFDGGAVADDGTLEKDIDLSISLQLATLLTVAGYRVRMTRTDDTATDGGIAGPLHTRKVADMQARLSMINETDVTLCISVHLNQYSAAAPRGAQFFFSPRREEATALAEHLHASVRSLLQPENKRPIKKGTKNIYLLYYADTPTVIAECGFLSNPEERELLKEDAYQRQMAFCLADGILRYLTATAPASPSSRS